MVKTFFAVFLAILAAAIAVFGCITWVELMNERHEMARQEALKKLPVQKPAFTPSFNFQRTSPTP